MYPTPVTPAVLQNVESFDVNENMKILIEICGFNFCFPDVNSLSQIWSTFFLNTESINDSYMYKHIYVCVYVSNKGNE